MCVLRLDWQERLMGTKTVSKTWSTDITISKPKAGKMTQWVEALATKPDHLSSRTRTHMGEEKKQLVQAAL